LRNPEQRHPHPPVFLRKSAELLEKKRVAFLLSAKKCKEWQKSAQEFEKAEVRYRNSETSGEKRDANPLTPGAFVRISKERSCGRGHL
jgi:hypothetical protein